MVTDLSAEKRSSYSHSVHGLIDLAYSRMGDGPLLSDVAARGVQIAGDPDATVNEFTAVIEQDPGLTARFLGVANSAMYGSPRTIKCLNQAVMRLGFRECQNIIYASGIARLM